MRNDADDDDERPRDAPPDWDGRANGRTGETRTGIPDDEHTPDVNIGRGVRDDGAQIESPSSPSRTRSTDSEPPLTSTSTTPPRENTLVLPMRALADSFAPLLRCPACSPPSRLLSPTTLHCGHTVCAKHVRTEFPAPSSSSAHPTPADLPPAPESSTHRHASRSPATPANAPPQLLTVPTCPLPTCRPRVRQQVIAPNIPPESTVAYYPPITQPAPAAAESVRVTVPDPRLDVSVGRVLYLLDKARRWEEVDEPNTERTAGHSDGTDDEGQESDEYDTIDAHPDLKSSTSAARHDRRRSRPTQGARKRARRDELSDGRHHRHVSRSELVERFNKEITESLTCEICFTLLYQPVTTPCQHVSHLHLIFHISFQTYRSLFFFRPSVQNAYIVLLTTDQSALSVDRICHRSLTSKITHSTRLSFPSVSYLRIIYILHL